MSTKNKEYFIGLDIGTNSVGWAVTDESYNVLKFRGKRMWGVRLFEEGQTAKERRVYRSNRRRLERRKNRLELLEMLFSEEISKIDKAFFLRLKESKYHISDKKIETLNVLFDDNTFCDKDFFEKYPTIYHLREALMSDDNKHDIREIFLAIHHIIKYRGHFLLKGEISDNGDSIGILLGDLIKKLNLNNYLEEGILSDSEVDSILEIIKENKMTITDKTSKIKAICKKNKCLLEFLKVAIGGTGQLKNMFNDEDLQELDNDVKKICFSSKDYDEVRDRFEEVLGDRIEYIDLAKKLYDSLILMKIKPEGKSLSQAKIDAYNKHKNDLRLLKKITKSNKSVYDSIFKESKTSDDKKYKERPSYASYIKNNENGKGTNREDFYKYLKDQLKKIGDSAEKEQVLNDIELLDFLPLQRVKENGTIPYQIHANELRKILEKASKHHDFLNKTIDGLSVFEMIMKLMTFRIPYYVGPINDFHSKGNGNNRSNAWVVRNSNEKVTPWNFDKVIDIEASSEKFIENLTNKCTYLRNEDVLPKQSLLYSEFCLLNELNNLKCDGKVLPTNVKQDMIENVFLKKHGKITKNKISEFLKMQGYCDGKCEITGMDFEIKSDLKSHREMMDILGNDFNYMMVEDLIRWITIFGDSSKILESKIKKIYGDRLTKEQIRKITNLKYKDWGNFSSKFLSMIFSDKLVNVETGEHMNIIEAMRSFPENLMQLLSNRYDFMEKINEINNSTVSEIEKIEYSILDDLYVSPAVKRSLWQSIKITEEIVKIMGCQPKKIFIETTRKHGEKGKRTESRKAKLKLSYKAVKDIDQKLINELESYNDSDLRRKKLYLYFTQLGKCMYCDEDIVLEKLFTNDYQIDHIYPRSKTKDDSFDNLVLVHLNCNQIKEDKLLSSDVRKNKLMFWKSLHECGLISDRKFEKLTRTDDFTDEELSGFIARQIVETSQSAKAAAEIMGRIYRESSIVYVKAENVSDFRNESDPNKENNKKKKGKEISNEFKEEKENPFVKVREINDHHHAKDAYLNIVVGNVYDEKFTKNPMNFISKKDGRKYNLAKLFYQDLKNGEKVIWDKSKSIKTVEKMMRCNDVRVTRMVKEQKGALYNATLYKKSEAKPESYFPIKMGDERLKDVKKYGGFTNIKIAYYSIVRYELEGKKKKIVTRIVPIPVFVAKSIKDEKMLENYIYVKLSEIKKGKISSLKILFEKLYVGSLIKVDDFIYYLGGKTNDRVCIDSAVQVIFGLEKLSYIKKLVKINNIKEIDDESAVYYGISKEKNIEIYKIIIDKMSTGMFLKKKNNKVDDFASSNTLETFEGLSLIEQSNLLLEMINAITDKKTVYKLEPLIKLSRSIISMDISNLKNFEVINQSVTGLFENNIDIIK